MNSARLPARTRVGGVRLQVWAPGPAPHEDQARLIEWTLVVPSPAAARAAGERLRDAGAPVLAEGDDLIVTDPWGTRLRVTP